LVLDRASSYIGVMIDDLVLQGITEPYRMLTARAEYRLRLRADNAATRLTPLALEMGCVSADRRDWFVSRETQRANLRSALDRCVSGAELADIGLTVRDRGERQSLFDWLRFLSPTRAQLLQICPDVDAVSDALLAEMLEDARYAPYIARQEAEIREMRANESIALAGVDFSAVPGLSNEMVERLHAAQPATLGAAERVQGITPAALAAILVAAKRHASVAA
jgi:tRNA uridine 5-carboxymethylaminomethyl modification enzyme